MLCIFHHWGIQLILVCSWARPAILAAGKGRGGMFIIIRTSNLRKLQTVLFVNGWILSYFCVILSGDCVYSCSLLRRFVEICVFTNKFPYIRRNIFVAVYKQTEQSPHSERIPL